MKKWLDPDGRPAPKDMTDEERITIDSEILQFAEWDVQCPMRCDYSELRNNYIILYCAYLKKELEIEALKIS